mgnify:CR=1 FL=1
MHNFYFMLNKLFGFIFCFSLSLSLFGQKDGDLNMEIIAHVPGLGSGIWHFVDKNGIEYACIGLQSALVIYSLEDPAKPIERKRIPGVNTIWRECFSYKDFIYAVTDQVSDGLIIVDMSKAPNDIQFKFWRTDIPYNNEMKTLNTCHTNFVDENGILTLNGCNPWQGVLFFDLKPDPNNPKYLGAELKRYCHDMYMRGDTLYTADIYEGLTTIYNVKDKKNPIELTNFKTPFAFTHNVWISDDAKYIFTTDEREEAYVASYDISDYSKIKLLDRYKPLDTDGLGVIPHNVRYLDGYIITSYYTDGIKICDVHRPDNIVEVGSIDTYSGPDGGFHGCWGVSPFLPSKTIIASDIEGGLFVIRPTYIRACYLEGMVLDSITRDPIAGATVIIQGTRKNKEVSDGLGVFKTGCATAGTYKAIFTHPDYISKEIEVTMENGIVTAVEALLNSKSSIVTTLVVKDSKTNDIIPGAKVLYANSSRNIELVTNTSGVATAKLPAAEGNFKIYAGKWGYKEGSDTFDVNLPVSQKVIYLDKSYHDDFIIDQGWTVYGDATKGGWVRAEPVGTRNQGQQCQPEFDLDTDLGNMCYVTGNSSTEASVDDVDGGNTILVSPMMDLSSYGEPVFHFSRWFCNTGGNGTPNDKLYVRLNNAGGSIVLDSVLSSDRSWNLREIKLSPTFDKTQACWITVETGDTPEGHIVEAAFDGFSVTDARPVASNDPKTKILGFEVNPVVFETETTVRIHSVSGMDQQLIISDMQGKMVQSLELHRSASVQNIKIGSGLKTGMYILSLKAQDGQLFSQKVIKQ